MSKQIYTYTELAEATSLSTRTLRRLVDRGELAAPVRITEYRVGFLASDVEAFLDQLKKRVY
ncbi:MAG: helix-turn-helix domain-containing protein [Alphaproteobacteria bacterium]|nr:helix-turn-helix domain-containing protein [Alphaproteobacteria bacterium]